MSISKEQLISGMIEDSAIFTKKLAKKTVKKTKKLSFNLVTLAAIFSLVLGGDYLSNQHLYDKHYDPNYGLKQKTYLGVASPFTFLEKKSQNDINELSQYQWSDYFVYIKELKVTKNEPIEIRTENNLTSFKKFFSSYKNQNFSNVNDSLKSMQLSLLAIGYKFLVQNSHLDNNEELQTIKNEISQIAHIHYLDTKLKNKIKSDNIVNFCNSGIIGRSSCAIQNSNVLLDLTQKDKLNNQSYYDIGLYTNQYNFFLSIMSFSNEELRDKNFESKGEIIRLSKMSPEEIIKIQNYRI